MQQLIEEQLEEGETHKIDDTIVRVLQAVVQLLAIIFEPFLSSFSPVWCNFSHYLRALLVHFPRCRVADVTLRQ